MSQNLFEIIINRIKEERIKVSKFILCINGEPLTDPDLFNRIRKLKEDFPHVKVEFTTNFALANDEVIREIYNCGLDRIVCSLNSIDAREYEQIMGIDYKRTINNIEMLIKNKESKKSNLEIVLSIVATRDNISEVNKFKEMWEKEAKIRVIKLGQWIGKEKPSDISIHSREGVCDILYRTINILANGDYALCCFDAEGIIGRNVMNVSIREAWESAVFANIRKHHLLGGKTNIECLNCGF